MNSITSKYRFCQQVVKYSLKYGATKASVRYKVCRKVIYDWRKKYDGTWKSLMPRSRRPHHHPREHTPEEYELIRRHYPYYKDDKIRLWDKLREKGYTRCYKSMLRVIRRMNLKVSPDKRKEYKPKPYAKAEYPGQKMQVDVKYVPTSCVVNGKKYYQYTAVDECARWCFREMYEEHSTASSLDFMKKLIHCCPFPIRDVQTDNGTEWTKALLTNDPTKKTCFELFLEECGIRYHRIRVATPRHNGKVERQHRLDGERFYSKLRMYSLADGRKQLAAYNKLSNTIPKCCLGFRSPNDVLSDYIHLF